MARIRTIKPDFFTDEDIAKLPPLHRLAFQGLWCHADKAGRLEDRPSRLKVQILPYDNVDFGEVLANLAATRFVTRYTGPDGRAYLQIRTFEKHQRPRSDEEESQLPEPPLDTEIDTKPNLFSSGDVTAGLLGKERKGMERKGSSAEPSCVSTPSSPVVLQFETVGRGGLMFELRQEQIDEWVSMFPGVNVLAECRKALGWLKANPGRRKTVAGMPKFLYGWIERSVNRGDVVTQRSRGIPAAGTDDAIIEQNNKRYAGMRFGK